MTNKPPKLTLLTSDFPPTLGGGETLTYLLAKYLSRKRWQISVVTGQSATEKNKMNQDSYKGFRVFRIPLLQEFSRGEVGIKSILEKTYQTVKKTSPDIIHAFDFYPGYIGSIYSENENIPLVFTYFNTPHQDGRVLKMFTDIKLDKVMVLKFIKGIKFQVLITLSKHYVNSAIQLGISANLIRWCYPGPDPEIFTPEAKNTNFRKSLGVDNKEIFAVVPSRIAPRKRIETIIKAVSIIKSFPIKIIISGGGFVGKGYEKYHKSILNLIKQHKLSKIILLPKQRFKLKELGKLYASADIGILASTIEGLGLGVLEVMSCSTPMIATDTKGINEIISNKKTGLLFRVDDFQQLAKHIKLLATNYETRIKMGKEAKKSVAQKFELSKYIDLHDKTYKQLLHLQK